VHRSPARTPHIEVVELGHLDPIERQHRHAALGHVFDVLSEQAGDVEIADDDQWHSVFDKYLRTRRGDERPGQDVDPLIGGRTTPRDGNRDGVGIDGWLS